ncbi:MAG TPA: ABC transporter ATP-binding protein [Magnetospirillaceae bacterium]
MTAVAFDQVTLALGERRILDKVSLDIRDGEFVAVLGPNGAGKTTMMRAILGLVPASAGTIRVLDAPARRGNPGVGYLPQLHRPQEGLRLSARDFVGSAARGHLWGMPRLDAETKREVAWALDCVGATNLADRPLLNLSGGERQRILMALAMLGRPKLLLLDEPLISLDPNHQVAIVDLVRRLRDELGIAVLFSAHEINPLLGAIDRVLYLGGGQAALGSVDEVITGPVLSRLYGAEIDVIRLRGRIFVMAGAHDLERAEHRHAGHDHGHDHGAHEYQGN